MYSKKVKKALVILNGYPVSRQLLTYFWHKSDICICTDGSFHSVFHAGFTPDFIIGDMDSLKKEHLAKDILKNRIMLNYTRGNKSFQKTL